MTGRRYFAAGMLAVLTVDAIVAYHLTWLAMLIGGTIAASLIIGSLIGMWIAHGHVQPRRDELAARRRERAHAVPRKTA